MNMLLTQDMIVKQAAVALAERVTPISIPATTRGEKTSYAEIRLKPADLTMKIGEFVDRLIAPAMCALAGQVGKTGAAPSPLCGARCATAEWRGVAVLCASNDAGEYRFYVTHS